MLAGLQVVEVASWTYVPAAAAVLADWGADVIKIESPETGDPQRGLSSSGMVPVAPNGVEYLFELPNRGKRSVALNLRSPEGRDLLLELVATADVFLTNFLPPLRASLGIDVDDIRKANPDCIYVRGSAQGPRGPESDKGGYDASHFWGRVVAEWITPSGSPWPVDQPGAAFGDLLSSMSLAAGICSALLHRERTGETVVVDSSLLATALWATGVNIVAAGLFDMSNMPKVDRRQMANPLANTYRTADGRFLTLTMLQSDRFWPELVRTIGRAELADDPRFCDAASRAEHRVACIDALEAIFATRTLREWQLVLGDIEGVWAPMQTAAELLDDPQVAANGYVREIEGDSGARFRVVPSPVQFDEAPPDLVRAPLHGEHTDEVLIDLGLDMDQIIDLKIKGAIL